MRYILITGASSKIGSRMVDHFIKNGDYIIYHYNNNYKQVDSKNITYIQSDFSNLDEVKTKFNELFKKFNNIDLIINNASIFLNDDHKLSEKIMNINYFAPKLLNNLYHQNYKKGNIINITDNRVHSINRDLKKNIYYISKMKLHELLNEQILEFGKEFSINSIAPGPVFESDDCKGINFQNKISCNILKKNVDINDIISAIEFLYNCNSITGQNIILDCGENIFLDNRR